jgi:hypothetical protein
MPAGANELRQLILSLLAELEVDDWPGALELISVHQVAGHEDLVRGTSAIQSLGRAMLRRAQGRMEEARDLLDDTTAQLPRTMRGMSSTGRALAVLPVEAFEPDSDAHVSVRLARLCRREQIELEDFCERFAPGQVTAREVLVEALIEYMVLIEFNRFACRLRRKQPRDRDDALPVAPSRKALCDRATALRRLADPAGPGVSQSVWRDVGGLEGLRAEAFDALAKWPAAARWCGQEHAAGLLVRCSAVWVRKIARGEAPTD